MARKSKTLRILFSAVFALLLILTLVGCADKQSDQSNDDREGSIAPLDEGHGTAPVFELDPLAISPVQAAVGQDITISTTVRNFGNAAGIYTAELVINQHSVETRDVTVPSGGGQVLTFTVSRTEVGIYDVSLGGRSGSFAVAAPNTAPAFELDTLTISPAEALSGDEISIGTTVRNVGNAPGVYPAELVINGHTVETKDVAVPSGASAPLTFAVAETEAGVYDVSIGNRAGSFSVVVPTIAPVFQLDPLAIAPAEAYSRDNISITTTVRNAGNAAGIYTAELVINGFTVETRDVTVASGGSELLVFTVARTEPGAYDVAVGERSGSFTVSHPPLTLELDYMGIKCTDPVNRTGRGNIRLAVLVSDGTQENVEIQWIPLEPATAPLMSDHEVKRVGQQLFLTASVGDYFKVMFVAFRDNPSPPSSSFFAFMGRILGACYGQPELGGTLGGYIDAELANDPKLTYLGSYQRTWTADQEWGIGQYNGEGVENENLRLWFRIWSGSEPQEVATPVLVPNVSIQDVTVPALVEVGKTYSYNVVVTNNEDYPVTVTVVANSSVQGEVLNKEIAVLPHRAQSVSHSNAVFKPAGVRTMTYRVLKKGGAQVCTVSKTVEARDRFAGWYVGDVSVTTAMVGGTITARINMFDLAPGLYTMRVLRDVSWAPDEEVAQVSFYYDGTPTTRDLSFVALYAGGYHVVLSRDGTTVWAQENRIPPRLRVSA